MDEDINDETLQRRQPTLEIRIPISPNEQFLRMVHYFLESLQIFGGPIGRSAKCVVSVSRDAPYRDLSIECAWAANYDVEFQWLDEEVFEKHAYDATGFHRLDIESEADIVILADADLLIANDFDEVILDAYHSKKLLGFIAHLSPFTYVVNDFGLGKIISPKLLRYAVRQAAVVFGKLNNDPSHLWWHKICLEAGLSTPELNKVHTAWGLLSKDKKHRYCPYYYNYGFIVAPRPYFEKMAKTFPTDLDAVDRVIYNNDYKSQIANTLSCIRHNIPCGTLSINYNFAMNISDKRMRALNPDTNGNNSAEDIKVFHYLANGEFNKTDFANTKRLEQALQRRTKSASGRIFQSKLQTVHNGIIT